VAHEPAPVQAGEDVGHAEAAAGMAAAGAGQHLDDLDAEAPCGLFLSSVDFVGQFGHGFAFVPAWHPPAMRER
jgi:hypothetical protein